MIGSRVASLKRAQCPFWYRAPNDRLENLPRWGLLSLHGRKHHFAYSIGDRLLPRQSGQSASKDICASGIWNESFTAVNALV